MIRVRLWHWVILLSPWLLLMLDRRGERRLPHNTTLKAPVPNTAVGFAVTGPIPMFLPRTRAPRIRLQGCRRGCWQGWRGSWQGGSWHAHARTRSLQNLKVGWEEWLKKPIEQLNRIAVTMNSRGAGADADAGSDAGSGAGAGAGSGSGAGANADAGADADADSRMTRKEALMARLEDENAAGGGDNEGGIIARGIGRGREQGRNGQGTRASMRGRRRFRGASSAGSTTTSTADSATFESKDAIISKIIQMNRAGAWQPALDLVALIEAEAETEQEEQQAGGQLSSRALLTCLNTLEMSGDWQRAIKLSQRFPEAQDSAGLGPESYKVLLRFLFRSGCWSQAIDFVKRAMTHDVPLDLVTYSRIMKNFGKMCEECAISSSGGDVADPEAAMFSLDDVEQAMWRAGVEHDTLSWTTFIQSQTSAGDWEKALSCFERCSSLKIRPDYALYTAAAGAMQQGAQWRRALLLYKEVMLPVERDFRKPLPDAVFFTTLMSAMFTAGGEDGIANGYMIFERMCFFVVKPTLVTYKTLISEVTKIDGSHAPKAVGWYERMIYRDKIEPDSGLIRIMVGVCSKKRAKSANLWRRALLFYRDLRMEYPDELDSISCSAALTACEMGNMWDAAIEIFEHQKSVGIPVTEVSYTNLILLLSNNGRYKKALAIFEEMIEEGVVPDLVCYSALIGGCLRDLRWDLATELLDEMTSIGIYPGPVTHRFMIEAYEDREYDLYHTSLQRLNVAKTQKLNPGFNLYAEVLFAVLLLNRWKMGYSLFFEMIKSGAEIKPIMWHLVLAACCKRATYNWESVQMFKELRARNVTIDPKNKVRLYSVIRMLRNIQRYDKDDPAPQKIRRNLRPGDLDKKKRRSK